MNPLDQKSLYQLLFGGASQPPNLWTCPLQQGLPFLLQQAEKILLLAGGLAFAVGIMLTIFYYLTAYGSEERVKKGLDTLKWTMIGAVVIIVSALVIGWVVNIFLAPTGQATNLDDYQLHPTANCLESPASVQQQRQTVEQGEAGLKDSGIQPGFGAGAKP